MSRVLLVGESWFVHSIHQKGFDTFTSSEYEEGGAEFVAALEERGHDVTRIPSHRIEFDLPASAAELAALADVIVISDVGANTFQLPPAVFSHSRPVDDAIGALAEFTAAGGGLVMIGGYLSFSGIDAKARWGRTALADVLPVRILDRDDRIELPSGVDPLVSQPHPIVDPLDPCWPALLGLNELVAKPDADVLATVAEHPLLVVGTHGAGRTAAFSSDLAPHWATPAFLAWPGYGELFDRLVRWLSQEELA
ncbi:glutamine amidotransferase [Microbacterium sp. cx-55]|uniref:glutamine amidotransferase n=1 Tax=Microbacterium sp. cx-55 TaxID=2875948 RepID=UPI001CBD74D9|nr:glutamine amidotransferase [Microbacterium sp. cx-55]MBZ4488048.1 glutamine amidotransferase [Microbacterium sp. cx-55]UGB34546.1 glutamine amidotransferase [Microbacterium sp. cx-55]